jgi:adenylate kinase family enzyme
VKIIITGDPLTGKSTLARSLCLPIKHTDNLTGSWEERLEATMRWFSEPGPCIIAGVVCPYALVEWLKIHSGKPADKIIWLSKHLVLQLPKHRNMSKGMHTVWARIEPVLKQRGVEIDRREINTSETNILGER